MQRRNFIKLGVAAAVASALPWWSQAATVVELAPLPIPPLLLPDGNGKVALTLQQGESHWVAGVASKTWGINGPLLGPALQVQRGKKLDVTITNRLSEASTVHWHGLEVPGEVDGGPQAIIAPGQQRNVSFTLDQPAATCWFHPHIHGRTGYQVAQGLAGLLLIEDPVSQQLPLPKTWGVDDIPVILQDKRLNKNGQIDYQLDVMTAAVGWFGDRLLTNGTAYPQHSAPQGWLRLRLLNGCNARSLTVAASDGRPLQVIASDGGLLAAPVAVTQLSLLPGERFEVLVEVKVGQPFDMVSLPVQQMGMTLAPFNKPLPLLRVIPTQQKGSGSLPTKLADLPALPALDGLPSRVLQLSMDPQLDHQGMAALMARYGHGAMAGMSMDHGSAPMAGMKMDAGSMPGMKMEHGAMAGMAMDHAGMSHDASPEKSTSKGLDLSQANKINGRAFDMQHSAFDVKRGQYERWVISGEGDMMLHPFHIHGTQFRILSENGQPPAAHRQGWKDMVLVEGGRSEVLVRFMHLASAEQPYMAHCHLLEHEDTGMMLGFTVSA